MLYEVVSGLLVVSGCKQVVTTFKTTYLQPVSI